MSTTVGYFCIARFFFGSLASAPSYSINTINNNTVHMDMDVLEYIKCILN